MKTETLHRKLERYINGEAMPAETRQIQTWLSSSANTDYQLTAAEKLQMEQDILKDIQAATAYPLLYPSKQKPWWQKITAMF